MINGKFFSLLLLIASFTTTELIAQTRVKGRVTEELTGKPLPKTTIRYVEGNVSVSSDDNGEFEINVPWLSATECREKRRRSQRLLR